MVFIVVYLLLAGTWVGAMGYSLAVVQPKVVRFFPDEQRREEFLITLAHGNRWRVVALLAALLAAGIGAIATAADTAVAVGYAVAVGLDALAAVLFVHVSWRHWPARVFALPRELPGYQARLRRTATAMTALAGLAWVGALWVSVR